MTLAKSTRLSPFSPLEGGPRKTTHVSVGVLVEPEKPTSQPSLGIIHSCFHHKFPLLCVLIMSSQPSLSSSLPTNICLPFYFLLFTLGTSNPHSLHECFCTRKQRPLCQYRRTSKTNPLPTSLPALDRPPPGFARHSLSSLPLVDLFLFCSHTSGLHRGVCVSILPLLDRHQTGLPPLASQPAQLYLPFRV